MPHLAGGARLALALAVVSSLAACVGSVPAPPLTPARGAPLAACADLERTLAYPLTSFNAKPVGAGELSVASKPIACALPASRGAMNERTSPVDGKRYAIGFEMRLPEAWNGRFFYQANGGVDGSVVTATGAVSAGPGLDNALAQGFAVISSDAGHSGAQNGQLRHRPAGAPRLRLSRRRAADADGQGR